MLMAFTAIFMLGYGMNYRKKYQFAEERAKYYIDEYSKLLHQKKSSEVRLGQITEHLAPFLEQFKYDPKKARFIGNPIDYIVFEEDKVVFVEIKSGEARLTKNQAEIRDMIKDGKVEFETIKIK